MYTREYYTRPPGIVGFRIRKQTLCRDVLAVQKKMPFKTAVSVVLARTDTTSETRTILRMITTGHVANQYGHVSEYCTVLLESS